MDTTAVNAKDVMRLRERTGLGMMDCKAALAEAGGDMAKAEAILKERLKGKMDTRTDRAAGQGRIAVRIDGAAGSQRAAIVEVRAETDFTAKNDEFVAMADAVAALAAKDGSGDLSVTPAMTARIDEIRLKTGENISFGRGIAAAGAFFGSYVHHDGKLGVLLETSAAIPADVAIGICQHIAANVPTPMAIGEADMPKDLVEARRREAVEEAKASGKPTEIAEKMAQGKMRKFFEDHTLLGQKFVKDEKKSVRELLPAGVTVMRFVRMPLGGDAVHARAR
jgi:elongation factor Ts